MNGMAKKRYTNYKKQPIEMNFGYGFKGTLSSYGLDANRRKPSGIKAAIIREKGTNGEREMAYSMYLAGFDVKDVMMTDLISGRETLEDVTSSYSAVVSLTPTFSVLPRVGLVHSSTILRLRSTR